MARKPLTPEDIARGERLKRLRELRGFTQAQVYPGGEAKRSQVANVESGINKLTGHLVIQIAQGLGVSVDTLEAVRDGKMTPEDAARAPVARTGVALQLQTEDNDAVTRLERAAGMLERIHQIKPSRAWLLVRGIRLPTDALVYEEAVRRWREEEGTDLKVEQASGKTVEQLRKRVARKSKR